jgi:predicted metal-dependent hydrolase
MPRPSTPSSSPRNPAAPAGRRSDLQRSLFDDDPAAAPVPAHPPGLDHPAATHDVMLQGQRIGYALRRARRRSIGMVVTADGLQVSAPRWVAVRDIEAALHDKARWIIEKLHEQRERAARSLAARLEWRTGTTFPFLGEPLSLVLGGSATRQPVLVKSGEGLQLHVPLPEDAGPSRIARAVKHWLRAEALKVFQARCEFYTSRVGVRVTRLALSSARTRWGSASSSGSIRLHWRLAHFPLPVIDYVVVHELAHLREMNHSSRFWAIVASVLPDYEAARAELRSRTLPGFD